MAQQSNQIPICRVQERRVGGRVYNVQSRKADKDSTVWTFHESPTQYTTVFGVEYGPPMLRVQRDATGKTIWFRA